MQIIFAGQSFYSSCGPPSPEMAYVTAWPNWQTSQVGLDSAGIWLHDPIFIYLFIFNLFIVDKNIYIVKYQ